MSGEAQHLPVTIEFGFWGGSMGGRGTLLLTLSLMLGLVRGAAANDSDVEKAGADLRLGPEFPRLAGLTNIYVVALVNDRAQRFGLDVKELTTIVELRLRQAGIRLTPREEGNPDQTPLFVIVDAVPVGGQLYAVVCSARLVSMVQIHKNQNRTLTSIWTSDRFGLMDGPGARNAFRLMADEFANEYLAANPPDFKAPATQPAAK